MRPPPLAYSSSARYHCRKFTYSGPRTLLDPTFPACASSERSRRGSPALPAALFTHRGGECYPFSRNLYPSKMNICATMPGDCPGAYVSRFRICPGRIDKTPRFRADAEADSAPPSPCISILRIAGDVKSPRGRQLHTYVHCFRVPRLCTASCIYADCRHPMTTRLSLSLGLIRSC